MDLEFYQTMFEKAPIGLAYCEAVLNEDKHIIDLIYIKVNSSFKDIYRISTVNINNTKRSEIFIDKQIDKELAENIQKVIQDRIQVNFEYHSELINRHLKVEIHSTSENQVFIFVTDITKEINDTIEKSILIKTTNDIILELNENYTFTSVYTNYERNLSFEKDQLINRNIREIFNQKTSDSLIQAFKLAKETHEIQVISYQTLENETLKYYQASIFYVKFDEEYRYVISIRDITSQQNVENQLLEMNNRLTEIARQSRTVIWEVDLDGKYTYINSVSKDVFGYDNKDMIGHYFYEFYPIQDRLEFKEKVLGLMNRRESVVGFESPYQTKDGERIWLLSNSSPKFNEEGLCVGYRGSDVDITEKHKIQLALKQSEEKYRFITENTSDVIWIVNLDDYKFSYISPAVYQLRGYSAEEAMAQSINESMTPESWQLIQNTIENSLGDFILDPQHPKHYILTIEQYHKNGSMVWVEISVCYRFNELNQIEVIGISRDVTERKKIDDEIRYLSFHDQLTGLYNRRYYDIELERLNTARNLPISFITVDINGLKMTNDVFGHSSGDDLIKLASKTLKSVCREDDIIVRLGGDEFIVVLPQTNIKDCEKIVSRIHLSLKSQSDSKYTLSLSIGYSSKETMDQEIIDVVNQADRIMYQNKLIESEVYKRQLLGTIMNTLYKLDTDLRRHLKSLTNLVSQFGKYLKLSSNQINQLKLAAMYHDIGKIGIDIEDIRLYQTDRIKYEYLLRRQPELSYQILRYITQYTEIANIVLAYHENYDGSGYPRGLRKDEISNESMMVHIVNNYDKLRFNVGLNREDSITQLKMQKGKELDPILCEKFCQMIEEFKL